MHKLLRTAFGDHAMGEYRLLSDFLSSKHGKFPLKTDIIWSSLQSSYRWKHG